MAAASCADIRGLPRACQEGRGRVQRLFVLLVAGFSAVPTLVFVRPASFLGAAFVVAGWTRAKAAIRRDLRREALLA